MEGLSVAAAEDAAQRCVDACNLVLERGDTGALEDLLVPDAVVEVSEKVTEVLRGPAELAERLLPSARHGGLALLDVEAVGDDVVAGVAWADEPFVRAAEVRLVLAGDHIARIEWVQ